jgi:hypothetical protein
MQFRTAGLVLLASLGPQTLACAGDRLILSILDDLNPAFEALTRAEALGRVRHSQACRRLAQPTSGLSILKRMRAMGIFLLLLTTPCRRRPYSCSSRKRQLFYRSRRREHSIQLGSLSHGMRRGRVMASPFPMCRSGRLHARNLMALGRVAL